MKPKSPLLLKIIDACMLVAHARSGDLEEFLIALSKSHHVLIIPHAKNEAKDILMSSNTNVVIIVNFETILQKMFRQKVIDMDIKYDRLEKKFKELSQKLKNGRPRVELVDRHIIALACQLRAHICSSDGGIDRALSKIQKAYVFMSWRRYSERVQIQKS
jgi:hypothetical protein